MGPHQGDAIPSLFGPVESVPLELLPFPARVDGVTLGAGGLWRYSFIEVSWDPDTGAWVDADPGRFGDIGTGIGLAFETNNFQLRPPFFVNQMRPRGIVAGQMTCDFDMPGGILPVTTSPPVGLYPPNTILYDPVINLIWVNGGGNGGGGGPGGLPPAWSAWCPCVDGSHAPSGSGSGGGPAGSDLYYTPCCPGVGLGTRLAAVLAGGSCPERAYTLARHLGTGLDAWDTLPTDGGGPDTYGECSGDVWSVRCEGGQWQLIFQANPAAYTFPARSSSTCAPFNLIFDVPDLCGCGAAVMTVIKAP
jgi:hypothetical protein